MGADGGITIYSVKKLRDKFGDEKVEDFMTEFKSSLAYRQELEGQEYFTIYRGDNIYSEPFIETFNELIATPKEKRSEWHYRHDIERKEEIEEYRLHLVEMVKYLFEECRITYWEVWT